MACVNWQLFILWYSGVHAVPEGREVALFWNFYFYRWKKYLISLFYVPFGHAPKPSDPWFGDFTFFLLQWNGENDTQNVNKWILGGQILSGIFTIPLKQKKVKSPNQGSQASRSIPALLAQVHPFLNLDEISRSSQPTIQSVSNPFQYIPMAGLIFLSLFKKWKNSECQK